MIVIGEPALRDRALDRANVVDQLLDGRKEVIAIGRVGALATAVIAAVATAVVTAVIAIVAVTAATDHRSANQASRCQAKHT